MATIAERRTELSNALASEGLDYRDTWQGEPPYVLCFFNGSDLTPKPDDQVAMQFRVVGVLAKAMDDVALSSADVMVTDIMHALNALDGWRIDGIGPLARQTTNQVDWFYTVDFTVTTLVQIT